MIRIRKLELAIIILCCSIIGLSGMYLFDYYLRSFQNQENNKLVIDIGFPDRQDDKQENKQDEMESSVEDVFDYDALRKANKECIGWIQIDGTKIDYPIMQTSNNSFYLNHNFNREYAICGSIFMDYRNDINLVSEHLILYGHQMKDQSMFSQLNAYKKKSFCSEHSSITLYLKDQKYEYDIVAVYVTDTKQRGAYYQYLHSNTRREQIEYLNHVMAADQLYDTGITVKESDELLSLSTCEYSSKNGRLIVLARRSDHER